MSNVIDFAKFQNDAIRKEYEDADKARREAAQGDFRCALPRTVEEGERTLLGRLAPPYGRYGMGAVMRCFCAALLLLMLAKPALADDLNPDFSGFPRWQYVLQHEHFTPPARPFSGDLKRLAEHLHAKYSLVPYRHDTETFGERNHWATREETRLHGAADCKGIAEAEMFDLLEAGIPDRDVQIVVVYVRKTSEVHAVTRVRGWVLDIRASRVLTVEEFGRYYESIFAINRLGWSADSQQVASRE